MTTPMVKPSTADLLLMRRKRNREFAWRFHGDKSFNLLRHSSSHKRAKLQTCGTVAIPRISSFSTGISPNPKMATVVVKEEYIRHREVRGVLTSDIATDILDKNPTDTESAILETRNIRYSITMLAPEDFSDSKNPGSYNGRFNFGRSEMIGRQEFEELSLESKRWKNNKARSSIEACTVWKPMANKTAQAPTEKDIADVGHQLVKLYAEARETGPKANFKAAIVFLAKPADLDFGEDYSLYCLVELIVLWKNDNPPPTAAPADGTVIVLTDDDDDNHVPQTPLATARIKTESTSPRPSPKKKARRHVTPGQTNRTNKKKKKHTGTSTEPPVAPVEKPPLALTHQAASDKPVDTLIAYLKDWLYNNCCMPKTPFPEDDKNQVIQFFLDKVQPTEAQINLAIQIRGERAKNDESWEKFWDYLTEKLLHKTNWKETLTAKQFLVIHWHYKFLWPQKCPLFLHAVLDKVAELDLDQPVDWQQFYEWLKTTGKFQEEDFELLRVLLQGFKCYVNEWIDMGYFEQIHSFFQKQEDKARNALSNKLLGLSQDFAVAISLSCHAFIIKYRPDDDKDKYYGFFSGCKSSKSPTLIKTRNLDDVYTSDATKDPAIHLSIVLLVVLMSKLKKMLAPR